ncbi:hypothetical protein [Sinorhizobium meliloti]|uniref:hypothetical protein n=1 Tax=Rhizobium meliloti TaxID=382 RepID=UPI002090185F|nr:hypothetical protein [Sinorhizobium meliloti]MCO5965491.1 hypothetical protein [Sinorhizobium meliloti]
MLHFSEKNANARQMHTRKLTPLSPNGYVRTGRVDSVQRAMTLETISQMSDDPLISLPAVAR